MVVKIEADAFWISPDGNELIKVRSTHQQTIMDYAQEAPTVFGWSSDKIKKTYERNKEMQWYGMERTESRNTIVGDCIHRGWIRLRFHFRPSSIWHIQVGILDQKIIKNLLNAFLLPLKNRVLSDFTAKSHNPAIMLIDIQGGILLQTKSVDEGIKWLEEWQCR